MTNIIVSLSNNILKLSANTPDGFLTSFVEVSKESATGSKVLDVESISSSISEGLSELSENKLKSPQITFLVEPDDIYLNFVTLNKNTEDIDEKIIEEMKKKLSEVSLDDLYFSYQKIAPFVYQFIGVKKAHLERYLEITTTLGVPLKAVIPWVSMLPKHLNSNDPCIFLSKTPNNQVLALSELNGIYFCKVLDKEKTVDEIQLLVHELAVYKRSTPINKVYTLSDAKYDFGKDYEITPLLTLDDDATNAKGFEIHLLVEDVLAANTAYLATQLNLLNLLPMPVVETKSKALLYVGGLLGAALLIAGGFGIYTTLNKGSTDGGLAVNAEELPVVLSEEVMVEEPVITAEDLNKEDLKVRIENGAGIAGVAGTTQAYLEELDYIIESIGNADEVGREDTLLKFKESKKDFELLLKPDMEAGDFVVVIETDLDETAEYDVLIVVGLN